MRLLVLLCGIFEVPTLRNSSPGLVATNIGHNAFGFLIYLLRPFSLTVEEGAATAIYLASSPEVAGVTGKYFVKCRPERSSPASYDQDLARRLWDATEALIRNPSGPRA